MKGCVTEYNEVAQSTWLLFAVVNKVNVRGFEQGYRWVWLRLRLEGVNKVKVGWCD